jgi:4'-phosphopantetheinyl transferase
MMDFTPQCERVPTSSEEADLELWRIHLNPPPEQLPAAVALLSADERARRDRFKIEAVKRRFAIARASMRQLLAKAAGRDPRDIRFDYGPQGKPSIARAGNPGDIRFNLSHSGDTAVLAVTVGREVGVDVERLRDNVDFQKLARRFFSPVEAATLNRLAGDDLKRRFFRIWTAKEAYIKAVGLGLRIPLDQFAFQISENDAPRLTDASHDPPQMQRWRFHQFEFGDECVATVGVERTPLNPA